MTDLYSVTTDLHSVTSVKLLRDDSVRSQKAEKLLTVARMPFESVFTTGRTGLPILSFASELGTVEYKGLSLISALARQFMQAVILAALYKTAEEILPGVMSDDREEEDTK